ncbi:heterokaryon incompatibility protein [Stagonosporopsis vannaccii]|nr:heterokaryon incompatibility protein [Stagonosporopsis vannaccii]
MVCLICRNLLARQDGRFAKGTLDIRYEHHTNAKTFQQAVRQNCYICRALFSDLMAQLQSSVEQLHQDAIASKSHALEEESVLSKLARKSLSSKAFLFLEKLDRIYRLDIEVRFDQATIRHTFHLQCRSGAPTCPDRRSVHVRYRTLEHSHSASRTMPTEALHRDYGTAMQWLKECRCYASLPRFFYPTRLLSLSSVKASIAKNGNSTSSPHGSQAVVRLIETATWSRADHKSPSFKEGYKQYVTLSHCWGGLVSHRLLRSNYNDFIHGIPVGDLPKTFQDAIYFAASLDDVEYIWIDSLCIIQEDADDWHKEAAVMGRVYSETYLNLSATAAVNSTGGLFKNGDFELLKEDEVTLDIEGLPMAYDRKAIPQCPQQRIRFLSRQCTIVDASFWDNKVDKGPVNTRGWVLQERLMSPRVLHFCRDQVGWECACHDAAYKLTARRLHLSKTSDQHSNHSRVIGYIYQRLTNDARIAYSPFDLWAAVVNAYTKTALTQPKDKLIALSGLARIMSEETSCAYVAGLWRTNLASQLLWHIEPEFHSSTRTFLHTATFATQYRAPSFSWAAIDITGRGIVYAHATKRGVLVRIEDCIVESQTDDVFGIVSKAQITLWGSLHRARLVSMPSNRFGWYLVGRNDLDNECHTNVYLDCPQRDANCIDNRDAQIFVLPVARHDSFAGTSRNEYLVCLLLQPARERGTFTRIGITKLSPNADRVVMKKSTSKGSPDYEILKPCRNDATLPCNGKYDEKAGVHRISLI